MVGIIRRKRFLKNILSVSFFGSKVAPAIIKNIGTQDRVSESKKLAAHHLSPKELKFSPETCNRITIKHADIRSKLILRSIFTNLLTISQQAKLVLRKLSDFYEKDTIRKAKLHLNKKAATRLDQGQFKIKFW